MLKLTNIMMLAFSIALAVLVLMLSMHQITALQQYHDQLEELFAPADAQPYGGCDEAWQAPESEGAQWCRDHGYL